MAIGSAAQFRRMARTAAIFLVGALSLCGLAAGQTPPVTVGSVYPAPSDPTQSWSQIYRFAFYKGNVLALDTGGSALYQLAPGATSWTTIVSGGPLAKSGSFNSAGMAVDAQGTLYIGDTYPNNVTAAPNTLFWRVPYNSSTNTWDVSSGNSWGSNIVNSAGASVVGNGSLDVQFVNSSKMDGSGTLYWADQGTDGIYSVQVDNQGNVLGPATTILAGLKNTVWSMAVDVNGNVYFIENRVGKATIRVVGIFFVPPSQYGLTSSTESGDLEAKLANIETDSITYAGLTLDSAGNLYITSENNSSYNETVSAVQRIPNTCGSPAAVTDASCLNYGDKALVSPVGSNNPLGIGPNGYLWIPTYQDWTPSGSGAYPNIWAFVAWAPGELNLSPSPAGTAGPAGTLFVNFNEAITPGSIQITQPGSGSDFVATTTNPNPPSGNTTPTVPCTPVTASYAAMATCQYWVSLDARSPGAVSGLFTMSDSSGNVIQGSTAYVAGVGQGSEAAMLATPNLVQMATGLDQPMQVASDAQGNVFVADPGQHGVYEFPAGSSGTPGTSVGSFASPSGVAIDGSGDLYVADTGKIYEIPAAAGVEASGAQNEIASGFGDDVNLAVDGLGDLFIADPSHGRVAEITNPATSLSTTVGSGFTAPSAVATDNAGDLFVADGSNLWEITTSGAQPQIAQNLTAPVTGLAVDASGAVLVAQSGGILRIPQINGNYLINSAAPIESGTITVPNSIALDQAGNIYISDMSGGTPNLDDLQVSGNVYFGNTMVPTRAAETDLSIFNIGNAPLTFPGAPTFTGADPAIFAVTTPSGGTACDTTGATSTSSGSSCNVGVDMTPPDKGHYSGEISIPTNAGNVGGGSATAALSGDAVADLEQTQTTVTLNPSTTSYPGSTAVTVNVTPVPTSQAPATTNVPSGKVTITLTNTAQGTSQPPLVETAQATGDDTGTTATVNLTGLLGGTYNVTASYAGNLGELFQPSSSTGATLTVGQATPSIQLSEPPGIAANATNGVYYILQGSTTITLPVSVTSPVGIPTGTVAFMNGSQLADPTQAAVPLDANGNASFNVENLAAGTYTLTAVYSGDTNFAAVTSSVVTFEIIPPSVLITANPTSVSTPAGTPVSSTITLQSLVGFDKPNGVNISCDNSTLPSASECTFSVPQPDVCAPSATCTGTTTTVVTISTNIPVNVGANARNNPEGPSPFALAGVFGLGLLGLAFRKRAAAHRYLLSVVCLTLLLAGAVMGFTGCTNSGYTHAPPIPQYKTPAGTYNVSIVVSDETSGQQYSLPFTLGFTVK